MSARKIASKEQMAAFLGRLTEEGIKPHAVKIAMAHLNGEVAVIFYEIAPTFERSARNMGWRGGKAECGTMSRTKAEQFADSIAKTARNDGAVPWLRGRRPGRILVWTGSGSLCLNFKPDEGFSIEPGTTDMEWMS